LIASLGIYIVIVQLIAMVWGNDTKTLRMGLDATTEFGDDIVVTGAQWVTLVAAILSIGGFALFLLRSNLGLRLRALADNPIQFALFGYNMVIVGGLGTTAGPLVGAATLVGLPEVLRFLALPDAQAANLRLLIYGLLLVLMMHLRPQGIVGDYRMQ